MSRDEAGEKQRNADMDEHTIHQIHRKGMFIQKGTDCRAFKPCHVQE